MMEVGSPAGAARDGRLSTWGPVVGASVGLVFIVPENPLTNLDDPSHWGVLGYGVTLALLVARRTSPLDRPSPARRVLVGFLVGMPLIYLADWLRFGGSLLHLWIELGGALVYWATAALAVWRYPTLLALGIAGHGLWDMGHYGRVTYVPDWYAAGCVVVDVGIGLFVGLRLRGQARMDR